MPMGPSPCMCVPARVFIYIYVYGISCVSGCACECTWDLGQSPHCTGGKTESQWVVSLPGIPWGVGYSGNWNLSPEGCVWRRNLVCAGVTAVEIYMFVRMELWVVTWHHQLFKISHTWMIKMQIPRPTLTEHDSLRSEVQELHFKQMSR